MLKPISVGGYFLSIEGLKNSHFKYLSLFREAFNLKLIYVDLFIILIFNFLVKL